MLSIGECPFCESYGSIGVWRCSDGTTFVLQCDECDALWENPEKIGALDTIKPTSQGQLISDELKAKYFSRHSGWATKDEVINIGWLKYIKSEGKALGDL